MTALSPPMNMQAVGMQPAYIDPRMYEQQPVTRPGTLPVGTRVKIGEYKVTIDRFLSEGGFAHVYLVRSSTPIVTSNPTAGEHYLHVLKRLAVPSKQELQYVRQEVEVMKTLRGHPFIIDFIEASATELPNKAGYEVFILMEYAPGGGIIDMMNTRLSADNRLTESEVLNIFGDTVQAVAYMHSQQPPLMHRDLKVENILLASPTCFKLCDFGSTTTPLAHPPQSVPEIQALEADLNRTTTLQYRAPEMCDVWSRKPIGLPADVWALGVFLYKLCYYTTPFEAMGVLAIQTVQYSFPSFPVYSNRLQSMIKSILVEDQNQRPKIDAIHGEVCRMRGIDPRSLPRPSTKPQHTPQTSKPTTEQKPQTQPRATPQQTPQPQPKPAVARKPTLPPRPPPEVLPLKSPPPISSPKPSSPQSPGIFISASPIAAHATMFGDTIKPMRRGRPTAKAEVVNEPVEKEGFADTFQPPPADSEHAAFEEAYPSLEDFDRRSASIPKTEASASENLVPSVKQQVNQLQTSTSLSLPPVALERPASGFKEILSPSTSPPNTANLGAISSEKEVSRQVESRPQQKTEAKPAWTAKTYNQKSVLDRYRPEFISRGSQTSPEHTMFTHKERTLPKQTHSAPTPVQNGTPSVNLLHSPTQTQPKIKIPDLMDEPDVYDDQTKSEDKKKDEIDLLSDTMPTLESYPSHGNGAEADSSDDEDPEDLDVKRNVSVPANVPRSDQLLQGASTEPIPEIAAILEPKVKLDEAKATPPVKPIIQSKPASLQQPKTEPNVILPKPMSPPPLIAPIAQSGKPKAAISSLVSRYEIMNGESSPPAVQNRPKQRPTSMVVNNGVPFKLPGLASSPKPPSSPAPEPAKEELDEPFRGVAHMKNRWQTMASQQSQSFANRQTRPT